MTATGMAKKETDDNEKTKERSGVIKMARIGIKKSRIKSRKKNMTATGKAKREMATRKQRKERE